MENTFSIEENARESKRLKALLDKGIRTSLMKYDGVKHVSVGLKITNDEIVWERCFHVYVDKKVGKETLSKKALVPAKIQGIKTDVHEIGVAMAAVGCEDQTRYRPIKGGIAISNGLEMPLQIDPTTIQLARNSGTIGAIGRIKGACKCNTVALTNWHVLYVGNAGVPVQKGSRVFQPMASTNSNLSLDLPDPNSTDNDIGTVIDGEINPKADVGVFEINRSCSNCCGIPYENTIRGLETIMPGGFNGIRGHAVAHTGDIVYFVGAVSGPTKGYVISDSAAKTIDIPLAMICDRRITPGPILNIPVSGNLTIDFVGQLKLRIADGTHPCNSGSPSRFVNHGDSGSLLLNGENRAVGLIFATDEPANAVPVPDPTGVPALPAGSMPTLYGYANHYADVIAELKKLNIDFEINYSEPSTGGSKGVTAPVLFEPDNEMYLSWKDRIESDPATKAIADAVSRNRDEVLLLVNHCRPVTVVWHRAKGPGFAATIAGNVRDEILEFPKEVNGISMESMLERMYAILLEHGSHDLKQDLKKNGKKLIAAVKEGGIGFEEILVALTKNRRDE